MSDVTARNQWEDPQFEDVASQDYLLGENSPARAMGIQQVRLDNFGIQSDRRPYYLDN